MTWSSILERHAHSQKPWLVLPRNPCRDDACTTITYAELHSTATRIARALRARGVGVEDRVIVLADNTPESCLLLIAVLASGAAVVPFPPRGTMGRDAGWHERLSRTARDCDARCVIGGARLIATAGLPPSIAVHDFDELTATEAQSLPAGDDAAELAIVQYTSGTTASPRGVELTHANVFENVRAIGETIGATAQDVGVTWLPTYHDMGLIGSLLFGTYWNMTVVLMTPRSFLLRPESWLWAISRFRVTCTVGPNAAYHLCATKVEERRLEGLDLSTLRTAFNGSELVDPATIDGFAQRFAAYGFRPSAMYPVYGLAENTVAVTVPVSGAPPRIDWIEREVLETHALAVACDDAKEAKRRGVVSLGRPLRGQRARVVCPDTGRELADRMAGEIEVQGACVMRGYHGLPEVTARTIRPDGWLRTGDRGYMVDGELYVVGRSKQTIKRAGRTYDAEDIRSVVQGLDGVRGGIAAVFGMPNRSIASEDVAVLVESELTDEPSVARLVADIASRVQRHCGFRPDVIRVVPAGSVPRTTSGKVRHDEARRVLAEQFR
jgi:acyl-CoA synthetase (AMP-forming)/AMP-acid ligase II